MHRRGATQRRGRRGRVFLRRCIPTQIQHSCNGCAEMMSRQLAVLLISLSSALLTQTGLATADLASDLRDCETALKETLAIHHTVAWPGNRIGGSCDSGGPGTCDGEWHWRYDKTLILQGTGFDPAKEKVESARTIDRDVSGDASADVSWDAGSITYSGHVHKGSFGGGATALVRFEVIFREDTSDATIALIGRMCAAKVLGQGRP